MNFGNTKLILGNGGSAIGSPLDSHIILYTNNREQFKFTDDGKLKIGTKGSIITTHQDSHLIFHTNKYERLRINDQGRVGIGTKDQKAVLQITKTNNINTEEAMLRVNFNESWGLKLSQHNDGSSTVVITETGRIDSKLEFDSVALNTGGFIWLYNGITLIAKLTILVQPANQIDNYIWIAGASVDRNVFRWSDTNELEYQGAYLKDCIEAAGGTWPTGWSYQSNWYDYDNVHTSPPGDGESTWYIRTTDQTKTVDYNTYTAGNVRYELNQRGNDVNYGVLHIKDGDVAIATINEGGSLRKGKVGIGIRAPIVALHMEHTDAIKIPKGTTAERPTANAAVHKGYVRYNTTLDIFEGYGAGPAWGSLGGVIDVDQDTYIVAESSAGADNDELWFYTAGKERLQIKNDGKVGIGTDNPDSKLELNGNMILGYFLKIGSSWDLVTATGTKPNARRNAVSVMYNNEFIIHGGNDANTTYNDVWKLNLLNNEWNQVTTNGETSPTKTGHIAIAYVKKMFIFGGEDNDVYNLNLFTNTWTKAPVTGTKPNKRYYCSGVLHNTKIYIFGGWYGQTYYNDLWEFDIAENSWELISTSGSSPSIRNGHKAEVYNGEMYVFGGYYSSNRYNDLYKYNFSTKTWSQLSPTGAIPGIRNGSTINVYGNELIIFGGRNNSNNNLSDVYSYNFIDNKWIRRIASSNINRYWTSEIFYDGAIYIFGGINELDNLENTVYKLSIKEDTSNIPSDGLIIDGNLGIGTAQPTTTLTLKRKTDNFTYGSGTQMIDFKPYMYDETNNIPYDEEVIKASIYSGIDDVTYGLNTTRGYLGFMVRGSVTENPATNPILREVMRIDNQGYVGIGTVNPLHKLHIANLEINNTIQDLICLETQTSSEAGHPAVPGIAQGILFKNKWHTNSTKYSMARISAHSQPGYGGQLAFWTNNGANSPDDTLIERLRINEDGNVGIGINTPYARLDIENDGVAQEVLKLYQRNAESYGANSEAVPSNSSYSPYNPKGTLINLNSVGSSAQTNASLINFNAYGPNGGNTGVYLGNVSSGDNNGPGNLVFGRRTGATSWSESMRINKSGYVGIGTNNYVDTRSILHIKKNAGISFQADTGQTDSRNWRIRQDDYGAWGSLQISVGSNNTDFGDSSSDVVMTMLKNRNVGIGTTNPDRKVHIVGDVRIEGSLTTNGETTIINTNQNNTERLSITNDGTGPAIIANQKGSQPIVDFQDDGTSVFYIEDGGNVGIGTTDPYANLHVTNGTGDIWTTTTTAADCHMLIGGYEWGTNGTNETLKIGLGYFDNASANVPMYIGCRVITSPNDTTSALVFGTRNSEYDTTAAEERMCILPNGNVGIGTTNPDDKLHISGSGDTVLKIVSTNATSPGIELVRTSLNHPNHHNSSIFADDAWTDWKIYNNGSKLEFQAGYRTATSGNHLSTSPQTLVTSMTMLNNGNVGIGTTSPFGKLDIKHSNWTQTPSSSTMCDMLNLMVSSPSTTGENNMRTLLCFADGYRNNSATKDSYRVRCRMSGAGFDMIWNSSATETIGSNTSNNNFIFARDYTSFMNKNVGIGTTDPKGKLHIQGGLHVFANAVTASSDAEMASNAGDANIFMDVNNHAASTAKNGIIWKTKYQNNAGYTKTSAGIYFQPEGNYFRGGLAFYTNGTANQTTNASERLRIDMTGNVGIGTSSPQYKLDIRDSGTCKLNIYGGSTGSYAEIRLSGNNNNVSDPLLYLGAGPVNSEKCVYISSRYDYPLLFLQNNSEVMRIHDNGNVGIGTTNPGEKLSVNGSIMIKGSSNSTTTNESKLIFTRDLADSDESEYIAQIYTGNYSGPLILEAARGGGYIKTISNRGTTDPIFVVSHADGYERFRINGYGYCTLKPFNNSGINNTWIDSLSNNNKLFFGDANFGIGAGKFALDMGSNSNSECTAIWCYQGSGRGIRFCSTSDGDGHKVSQMTTRMIVHGDTGNVGIGTTKPGAKLQVNGNILFGDGATAGYTQSSSFYIGLSSNSNAVGVDGFTGMRLESHSTGGNYSQDLKFYTHHYGGGTGGTPRMTIRYDGKVGIGTIDPGNFKFKIYNNTGTNTNGSNLWHNHFCVEESSAAGAGMTFKAGTQTGYIYYGSNLSNPWIGTGSFGFATTATGNSTDVKMIITNDGKVGINNRLSTTATLDIWGPTNNPTTATMSTTSSQAVVRISGAQGQCLEIGGMGSANKYGVWMQTHNQSSTSNTQYSRNLCIQPIEGNVGIGTLSPFTKLHIRNNTDTTGTGDAFIPNLSGNPSNRKPAECLRLQGSYNDNGSGALIRFTNYHASGSNPSNDEYNLAGIAGYDHDSNWGGGLCFYTAPTATAGGGNLTARMNITPDGNVGIGTSSPKYPLHIKKSSAGGYYMVLGHTEFGANTTRLIGFGHIPNNASYYPPAYMGYKSYNGTSGSTQGHLIFGTRNTTSGTTEASERMRITDAGNVGIGTTSPDRGLCILDNQNTGQSIGIYSIGYNASYQEAASLKIFQHLPISSSTYRISDGGGNGNPAINIVTNYIGSGANSTSHLGGSIQFTTQTRDNPTSGGAHGQAYAAIYGGRHSVYDNYEGEMIFYTADTTNRASGANLNPRMTIKGGNVGIGTTSPNYALSLGTSEKAFALYENNGNYFYGMKVANVNGWGINFYTSSGNDADGNIRMCIKRDSGYVGVGITSPAGKLHTVGSSGVHALRVTGNCGNSAQAYLTGSNYGIRVTSAASSGSYYSAYFEGSSGNGLYVRDDGDVGIGTTSPSTRLHVKDTTCILTLETTQGDANGRYCYIDFKDSGGTFAWFGDGSGGNKLMYLYLTDNQPFVITGSTVSSTRVGIGNTNPGYMLDVSGDINFTGTLRQNGTAFSTSTNPFPLNAGSISGTAVIGKIRVGSWNYGSYDYMSIQHHSLGWSGVTGNYALRQDATGVTDINCASSKSIGFLCNNEYKMYMNSSGQFSINNSSSIMVDAKLSINVPDEGTMISSPDISQFLWRINHSQKWGIYWSTNGSGNNYYLHSDSNPNQVLFIGNNTTRAGIDLDNGDFITTGWYHRTAHNNGGLCGSYNSVGANDAKTNPIYTIGSNYKPNDATLGNMYGIGYSHTNTSFIGSETGSGWGMYVAADGDARIYLNGSTGSTYQTSWVRVGGSNGIYFQSYGGGWNMSDSSYIRSYGNKAVMIFRDDDGDNTLVELLRLQRHANDESSSAFAEGGYISMYVTDDNDTDYEGARISFRSDNAANNETSGRIGFWTSNSGTPTQRVSIDKSGNMIVTGDITAYGSISDLKLKENIKELDTKLILDKVLQLKPVSFKWIDDIENEKRKGKNDEGFIAQDVEKLWPMLVDEFETLKEECNDKFKYIHYNKLTVYTTAAIQEQQKQINQLKQDKETQKKEITELRNENNMLKEQMKSVLERLAALESK